ncbi:serine hydrolase [Clostridium paraputrificum]|uniref:serine hydrolase n=1 Tax=Clostridium TaxID=1485 RepID=UPI003D33B292
MCKHKVRDKRRNITKNNKGNKKRIVIFILALIVGFSASVLLEEKKIVENRSESDEERIKVAQAEAVKEDIKKKEREEADKITDKIKEKVEAILGSNKEAYGIYYYDLTTGSEYVLNENKEFEAASTVKVPIAMMVADKIKNKELSKTDKIAYEEYDYEGGAGVLQGDIKVNQKISIDELLKDMIVESDNIATNMLKRVVGSKDEYISKITGIEMNNHNNLLTPKQEKIILQNLYERQFDNPMYSEIIELMKNTSSHDRLDKYIPYEKVAHKIGDYADYINDIGIIYTDKPYILCVCTKGEGEKGRENIASISKAIYDIKSDKLS